MSLGIDRVSGAQTVGANCVAAEGLVPYGIRTAEGEEFRTVNGALIDNDPDTYDQRCEDAAQLKREAGLDVYKRQQLADAAADAVCGKPCPLDVGRHNGRYFAYVASFGAFTRSSYSATQAAKNALGHFAYILEGLGDLDSLRPYRCAVEADGQRYEGEFIFGAVCNSTSLGGLVKLDPARVRMDDGKFELLLLRMPKTALDLQNLITAMTRMQYDYPGVIPVS